VLAIVAVEGPIAYGPVMSTLGYSLTALGSTLLLIGVVSSPQGQLVNLLRAKPLVQTGQIAYGLYLLHEPASWAARAAVTRLTGIQIGWHSWLAVPLSFTVSFIAAWLSWTFFEEPILRHKDRFFFSQRSAR
jgi:peptidoglycan/LPS O-acetylase OafA/YrhL